MSESVDERGTAYAVGDGPAAVADAAAAAEALRVRVGELVLAHPGVLRLEPTLLGAVQGLRRGSSLDGVRLTTRGRVVDLDVNVATRSDHQARASALELHRQLLDLLADAGHVPGTVEISVLTVEEPAD